MNSLDNTKAQELITKYSLEQHPEGGWFSEVYTADLKLGSVEAKRSLCGNIYFLLKGEDISHFHQIDCDELWFYHSGCGLIVHVIDNDGTYKQYKLGIDQDADPMVIIPKGAIFAAENVDVASYTFISCITTPKFLYSGFRLVGSEELNKYNLPQKYFID